MEKGQEFCNARSGVSEFFYSMFMFLGDFLKATRKVRIGGQGMTLLGGLTGYLAFRPKAEDLAFVPNAIR